MFHFDLIWFTYTIFAPYCRSLPLSTKATSFGVISYGLSGKTRSLPCFTTLHSLFYVNKVKIIPDNIVELLSPVALAYWIKGDGSKEKTGLILCCDSFARKYTMKLIKALKARYGIICTLRKLTGKRPMTNLCDQRFNSHPNQCRKTSYAPFNAL